MAALENARHERFAQALAKGEPASTAYVTAGFKANDGNAIRLKGNEQVAARVSDLKERAATRTEITVAGITDRLLAIAVKCEGSTTAPMLSVARASLMDAAKLNGLVIDRGDNVNSSAVTVTYVTKATGEDPDPSDEDYETPP